MRSIEKGIAQFSRSCLSARRTGITQSARRSAEDAEFSEPIHQAQYPTLHDRYIEIQQIAEAIVSELQVAEKLGSMDLRELLNRLHFDDNAILDKQVER
jgi:hypothetical protein